jgi:predicted ATPase with chaperone activity
MLFGLLPDRIDIHVELQRLKCDKFSKTHLGESSAALHVLVKIAYPRQYQRIPRTG